jgi:hypothetical protein
MKDHLEERVTEMNKPSAAPAATSAGTAAPGREQ